MMEVEVQGSIHNAVVRFRANETLIADAQRRAREQGMTLSEYLRAVIRREVREAA